MFFAGFKSWMKLSSTRWALTFLGIFLTCSALLFGLLYFLLVHIFEEKDRELIDSAFRHYSVVYRDSGVSGLRHELALRSTAKEKDQLLVRLQLPSGESFLLQVPSDFEQYIPKDAETLLAQQVATEPPAEWLSLISPQDSEDVISVRAARQPDGAFLQVGTNSEDLEDLLGQFRRVFSAILAAGVIFGCLASWFFAKQWLKPIQNLISTLRALRSGVLKIRVEESASSDELATLTRLFNEMLDQNEKLIVGLRDSLDFVAHDLRTPMTRFRGRAELALASLQTEDWREGLSVGLEDSAEILSLLNGILETSEAETGAIHLQQRPLSVRALFSSLIDLYTIIAEDRKITLIMDVSEDFEIFVDARFKQAVANLIDNALKFSPPGKLVVLRARHTGKHSILRVIDEGPGIASTEHDKIWNRLYRADVSRQAPGFGLGLGLARSLVMAHGGSLGVVSELGRGSTFEILLPREGRVE